jgi:hypothetical protein
MNLDELPHQSPSIPRRWFAPLGLLLAGLLVSCHDLPQRAGVSVRVMAGQVQEPETYKVGPIPPVSVAGEENAVELPGGWLAGKAVVRAIRSGRASYLTVGNQWKSLVLAELLYEGGTVQTDEGAVCDLYLKQNGPVIRMTPATLLLFEKLRYRETTDQIVIQTVIGLEKGGILGLVNRLADASLYEIKTPAGVCRVRGDGHSTYDISGDGRVRVFEGTIELSSGANSFKISAGQMFDADTREVRQMPQD